MNLQASITLSAGGPGSGCRGSNCGRKDSEQILQRNGYKKASARGFGVEEGEQAYSKGRGADRHVAVVTDHEVRSHLPYGGIKGQYDTAYMSHGAFVKYMRKVYE